MAFTRPPVTAPDATFSAEGVTAWNAGYGVAGATVGGIPYCPTATSEAMSGMTWNAGGAAGEGLAITAGTAASAVSALSLTQTWNYNSAAINAVDWTFTDTSSHASTNAFRIRGGASGTTVLFTIGKDGSGNFAGGVNSSSITSGAITSTSNWTVNSVNSRVASGVYIGWSSASDNSALSDVNLSRIGAGVLGLGTGSAGSTAGTLRAAVLAAGGSDFTVTAANSVSPTSPNRTITISYGGTTYYLAAKTTND